jgi:hypothetical protein
MTYNRWQQEFSKINKEEGCTVLFIINGSSYEDFINETLKYGFGENNFYSIFDPQNKFVIENSCIPLTIIKESVLIDKKNQIRLIGSPFSTPEMTILFNTICSGKTE